MREPEDIPRRRRERANPGARISRFAARNAAIVGTFWLLLAVASGAWIFVHFTIDVRPNSYAGADPTLVASAEALRVAFPGLENRISAIVESSDPDQARSAATRLAAMLKDRPDLFVDVFAPKTAESARQQSLHFMEAAELERLVERTERMAPLFQAIAASPNLHGFAELVVQVARAVADGRSPSGLDRLFAEAAQTVQAEIVKQPRALDWTGLAVQPTRGDERQYVVEAGTVGDYSRFDPFFPAVSQFRQIAGLIQAELGESGTIRIDRLPSSGTDHSPGGIALPGAVAAILTVLALVFCLPQLRLAFPITLYLTVAAVVLAALLEAAAGPWTVPAVATLGVLLVLSSGFAAITAWRYAVGIALDLPAVQSLAMVGQRSGPAVAASVAAMAVGLPMFVMAHPEATPQLAAAAAAGPVLVAALTFLCLPAFLALVPVNPEKIETHWLTPDLAEDEEVERWPLARSLAAIAILCASVFAIPLLLLSDIRPKAVAVSSEPIQVLASPGDSARQLAARLSTIPGVEKVTWVESFLPADEERKLLALSRLRGILPTVPENPLPDEAEVLRTDFARLQESLLAIANQPGVSEGLAKSAGDLRRSLALFDSPQPAAPGAILRLQTALFSRFGELLQAIDHLGQTAPLTVGGLDADVERRFIAPDGRWRIEVTPRPNADIVDAVRAVDPSIVTDDLLERSQQQTMLRRMGLSGIAVVVVFFVAVSLATMRWAAPILAFPPIAVVAVAMWALFAATGVPFSVVYLTAPAVAVSLAIAAIASYAMRLRRSQDEEDGWAGSVILGACVCLAPSAALMLVTMDDLARLGALLCAAILLHLLIALVVTPQIGKWLVTHDDRN